MLLKCHCRTPYCGHLIRLNGEIRYTNCIRLSLSDEGLTENFHSDRNPTNSSLREVRCALSSRMH
jgi:hypothetical protein